MRANPVDNFTPAAEEALHQQHAEDRRRSSMRLHISAEDMERMMTQFVASHGGVTMCPPTYAVPSPHYHVAPVICRQTVVLPLVRGTAPPRQSSQAAARPHVGVRSASAVAPAACRRG
jgi:hypothetical protein